ncbi:helix-turn-helix domain-containing protein [Tenacibaculum adriaticum]
MRYLYLMILSISLNNFQSWALANYLFQHKFILDYLQLPWHFLSAPFFYMFLVHYVDIAKKSIKILKVIIPLFLLACVLQIGFVLYFKDKGTHEELDLMYEKYTSIEEVLSFITSVSIFTYSFYILYKKEKLFLKILSYDNLKWVYTFFKLLVFVYVFWILALIVKFSLNFTGFLFSYYPLRIFTTIIIFLLGYQGIRHLRIFKERKQIRENIEIENTEETNTLEIPTSINDVSDEQFIKIDNFINENKKYLCPKYTLQNVSQDLGIGLSTLSAIINNNANKSFVDYINEMRINQAKKLLVDPKYNNYTIVSIGLESGFNSKSTFYNVFKKHVGCTPLRYKESKK